MIRKILLVGAGGHARSCIDVIERGGAYEILGLVGKESEVGSDVSGYLVVGTDAELPRLRSQVDRGLVTVGQIKSATARVELAARLIGAGYELPVIVSPEACVSHRAKIGGGTIIMHGAVVNSGAVIGRNCIINSKALVEHDVEVGDHCHISTGAILNGGVRVRECCFVGSGTVVRQMISIGERSVIGMGQRVLTDCEPDSMVI